jgi:hypothetical protein
MKNVLAIALLVAVGLAISACGTADPTSPSLSHGGPSGAGFSSSASAAPAAAAPDSSGQNSAESQSGGLMFGSGT